MRKFQPKPSKPRCNICLETPKLGRIVDNSEKSRRYINFSVAFQGGPPWNKIPPLGAAALKDANRFVTMNTKYMNRTLASRGPPAMLRYRESTKWVIWHEITTFLKKENCKKKWKAFNFPERTYFADFWKFWFFVNFWKFWDFWFPLHSLRKRRYVEKDLYVENLKNFKISRKIKNFTLTKCLVILPIFMIWENP